MESWNTIQQQNPELLYNMTEPAKYSSYGYDLVYLFAYALTEYHELYGIPDNLNDYDVTKVREILVQTSFLGLTGNVSLNDFGDRIYVCQIYKNIYISVSNIYIKILIYCIGILWIMFDYKT